MSHVCGDLRCQVCTILRFSETGTCIYLKPLLQSFRLTWCWVTVFSQIIDAAVYRANQRSVVSFEVNTEDCRLMNGSFGFILQSSRSQCFFLSVTFVCILHYSWNSFGAQFSVISWADTSSCAVVGRHDFTKALSRSRCEDGFKTTQGSF